MISRKKLKSLAGTAAFGRGEGYCDRVGCLRLQKHGVQAKVSGQRVYEVRLTWKDGFDYQCIVNDVGYGAYAIQGLLR